MWSQPFGWPHPLQGRALYHARMAATCVDTGKAGCYHAPHSPPTHLARRMPLESSAFNSPSTDDLITRCLAGDQAAWDAVHRQYKRKVYNVAYKFVGRHEEAEDLTQEIFLKLHRALHTFDRRANFQTWLISIARNLCIDYYRSVRKERETIDRTVEPHEVAQPVTGGGPLGALEQQDLRDLLRQAFERLPPALRIAVMMRDIQERSYLEIAQALGVPEGTVKSRINRGRRELARHVRRLERAGGPVPDGGHEDSPHP